MRSIVYAGNDFSEICSAEVIERAANPIVAEAMAVPGRAGALLVSGYMPPVDVRVRLFMDMGHNPGFSGMARMRGTLRRWLSWLDSGTWREHVVVRTDEPVAGLCSVHAESSLCELLDDFIEEAQLVSRTEAQALAAVLAPRRRGVPGDGGAVHSAGAGVQGVRAWQARGQGRIACGRPPIFAIDGLLACCVGSD